MMNALVAVALVLTECTSHTGTTEKRKKYAQLVMPDGTIVEGEYIDSSRYSNGWSFFIIDGVTYWTNQLRVVV